MTDNVSGKMANLAKHLAPKEPDIFPKTSHSEYFNYICRKHDSKQMLTCFVSVTLVCSANKYTLSTVVLAASFCYNPGNPQNN